MRPGSPFGSSWRDSPAATARRSSPGRRSWARRAIRTAVAPSWAADRGGSTRSEWHVGDLLRQLGLPLLLQRLLRRLLVHRLLRVLVLARHVRDLPVVAVDT